MSSLKTVRIRALGASLCLTLAALWPATVLAQGQGRPIQPREPAEGAEIPAELRFADLKLGPLYLQPHIGVQGFGWDSNVLGLPSGAEVGDLRATLSGGVRLAIPAREAHLVTGDASINYLWYNDFEDLRAFNPVLAATYEYTSARFDGSASVRYIDADRTQVDFLEVDGQPVRPEDGIFLRSRQRTLLTEASITWRVGTVMFLEPAVSRRIVRFGTDTAPEEELALALDRTEESIGGSIGYQWTPRTSVGLTGDRLVYDYETPGNPRDAETYRLAFDLRMREPGPITGRVSVGYRNLAPREVESTSFSGAILDGSLLITPGGIAEVRVFGNRDVFPSIWFSNFYALRQGGGIDFLVGLSRRLGVGVDASLYEHSYANEETVEQPDGSVVTARRLDRIYRYGGRVTWGISSSELTLRVGYVNRVSNFAIADNQQFVISTGYTFIY